MPDIQSGRVHCMTLLTRFGGHVYVVVYYCRTYVKAVRGRRVKRGDVCRGMLRAAACVDESDHHALMYV